MYLVHGVCEKLSERSFMTNSSLSGRMLEHKYSLSIQEAAEYYGIGEKRLAADFEPLSQRGFVEKCQNITQIITQKTRENLEILTCNNCCRMIHHMS